MRSETKDAVREVFRSFISDQHTKLARKGIGDIRLAYPFHRLFFTEAQVGAARTERSVVTAMGSVLYPQLAQAVALDRFTDVHLELEIAGTINDAAVNMIEEIVTTLRTGPRQRTVDRRPDHERELSEILNSLGGGQSRRSVIADLHIGDFTGGPLFVELKTPLPNLDIAAESKRKLLYYLAIRARERDWERASIPGTHLQPLSHTREIRPFRHQAGDGHEKPGSHRSGAMGFHWRPRHIRRNPLN